MIILTANPNPYLTGFYALPEWAVALALGIVVICGIVILLVTRSKDDEVITVNTTITGPTDTANREGAVRQAGDTRSNSESTTDEPGELVTFTPALKPTPQEQLKRDNPSRDPEYQSTEPTPESKALEGTDFEPVNPFQFTQEQQLEKKLRDDPPPVVVNVLPVEEPAPVCVEETPVTNLGEEVAAVLEDRYAAKTPTYKTYAEAFRREWRKRGAGAPAPNKFVIAGYYRELQQNQ